jgi:hypothetical protein
MPGVSRDQDEVMPNGGGGDKDVQSAVIDLSFSGAQFPPK